MRPLSEIIADLQQYDDYHIIFVEGPGKELLDEVERMRKIIDMYALVGREQDQRRIAQLEATKLRNGEHITELQNRVMQLVSQCRS